MLLARGGEPVRWTAALGWACTWALGAALGVALGGYLTLTSGAGAPGQSALDPTTDLVILPIAAFGIVFALHLGGQLVLGVIRGRRVAQPQSERYHRDEEPTE
ncbi:MAG: hypothetical protein D9V44_04655 [Actinobacteria bacterium]|nr:MAG: hypothetical protein D9V44_04655 [Actinomycetota bacterium]